MKIGRLGKWRLANQKTVVLRDKAASLGLAIRVPPEHQTTDLMRTSSYHSNVDLLDPPGDRR